MKDITRVLTIHKIAALFVTLFFLGERNVDERFIMVTTLVFLCLFTTQIVVELIVNRKQNKWNKWSLTLWLPIGAVGYLYFYGTSELLPIFILFLIEIIYDLVQVSSNSQTEQIKNQIQSNLRFFVLAFFIPIFVLLLYRPSKMLTVMSLLVSYSLLYTIWFMEKSLQYKRQILAEREKVIKLDEKIKNNNQLLKTIKYSAMLEERNRLAIRLHDKIGHNISGSIMMLEAAMLNIQKDQEKSLNGIRKATENLRSGVDDIRMALREERPVMGQITSNDIQILLEEFFASHEIHTFFRIQGEASAVPFEVWQCIKENVAELLTNVLKHSTATSFTVELQVLPAMIKVLYFDNGTNQQDSVIGNREIKRGLGLDAIEERTRRANGTCFFEKNEFGFVTTNIFRKV